MRTRGQPVLRRRWRWWAQLGLLQAWALVPVCKALHRWRQLLIQAQVCKQPPPRQQQQRQPRMQIHICKVHQLQLGQAYAGWVTRILQRCRCMRTTCQIHRACWRQELERMRFLTCSLEWCLACQQALAHSHRQGSRWIYLDHCLRVTPLVTAG